MARSQKHPNFEPQPAGCTAFAAHPRERADATGGPLLPDRNPGQWPAPARPLRLAHLPGWLWGKKSDDQWTVLDSNSASDSDLWIAFAISSVSVLILLLFRRPILVCLFDPDIATTLGIPSRLISYGIFTLIILVLVSSLQAVGAFLTLGLLVGPAATVYLLTNKPSHLFWGGGIIGGLGSLLAFYLSFPLGWHLGATIILVLGVIFCTAYLYSSRCGRLKQRGKNSSQVQ